MPSSHLILCRSLLLLSVFPSIRVFSNELTLCLRWPVYWSFSFSIIPSNEYSGLIFFRIDWFDPCCLRHSQESLPAQQFENINSLVFSLLYGPVLTSIHDHWTFVDKVMSLLSNMLSRLVMTFLPRSKRLLISWLQSPSAVILEPPLPKTKSVTLSILSPSICHEVMGPDAMILVF